jgi:hypothetical protein
VLDDILHCVCEGDNTENRLDVFEDIDGMFCVKIGRFVSKCEVDGPRGM